MFEFKKTDKKENTFSFVFEGQEYSLPHSLNLIPWYADIVPCLENEGSVSILFSESRSPEVLSGKKVAVDSNTFSIYGIKNGVLTLTKNGDSINIDNGTNDFILELTDFVQKNIDTFAIEERTLSVDKEGNITGSNVSSNKNEILEACFVANAIIKDGKTWNNMYD